MNAYDFLKQAKALKIKIRNKELERINYIELGTSITAPTNNEPVQKAFTNSKVENVGIRCADLSTEALILKNQYLDTTLNIIKTIEKLKDVNEYDVLHKYYIEDLSLEEIASEKCYSISYVKKIKKSAIQNIQYILNMTPNDT